MPSFAAIEQRIGSFRAEGRRLFATTSFQSHSVALLHMLSRIDRTIPVYYADTGYLFPATLTFRDRLAEALGLRFIGLRPAVPKSQQRDANGALLFAWDPDRCCDINKVRPLEPILASHDVWINGVRADQSDVRRALQVEQPAAFGCLRYHPLLDWTAAMVQDYLVQHRLPAHPLEAEGYASIGCEPCTRKRIDGFDARTSRWYGLKKTECGLNTTLAQPGGDPLP
jgi:phosphoadenosine phosphosulfate reductase